MLDQAFTCVTGRLAGTVKWLPVYDKNGKWLPKTDSKGNVIKDRKTGKPLPSGRAIFTLAVNNTGKKGDGSSNPPTYITMVDWSWGRFQNFYRKYFPEGTEATFHCDVRSYKKDHGSDYPDHVRYHNRTQFVVQRMFPGNRSEKGETLDSYEVAIKGANGKMKPITCTIEPKRRGNRRGADVGESGNFDEYFDEVSGSSNDTDDSTPDWLGD